MDFEAGMDNLERMLHDARAEPTDLPLSVLKNITNNFSNDQEVGRGGFAIVYKGRLRNGIVAVKKLHQTLEMQEKKYNQEVALLMRGEVVMADIRHRLLCFEFLPNGSLDGYITGANQRLEWSTRYKLIKGICEGLNYLHQKNIAHLDLKPANILLDYNMVPKIADFGLSRCFDEGQSQTIASKLVGSQGYLAPEFYDRVITLKLDIYSLGVIIIEILTGKKGHFLIENVLESWSNRLKPSQAGTLLEQVRVCSEIGLECIDRNPEKRPTTKCVTERLREMEIRCSSIETDFVCTSPVTHGDTRFEPGVLSEIGIECTDPNPERRPITPRIVDRLDKIGCTHGFIGSDLRTSSATHEKKVSTESQNPTPKTRSPVLDVHPRALALEDPLEPNKIHGLYLSNTDIEQANVRLSRDAKWQLKDAGAKDRKNVGANDLFDDHNKLITKPTAMPPSGGGGDKKGGKGDNNEVVEVQTKGNGNNGRKRASSAKQNNGASPGMGLIGGWPMSGDSSFPDICQMSGDLNFPDIDQMCGDPMTMGMFMDHLHIGSMQQGGATQGMPAGGRNTPSEQVWAVAMVGQQQQQQQGMQSGTEVLQVAAAAAGNPRAQQQYMAAAAAGSSMVRPQYIAHGGGDGHVNYGRGKIRGGEQLQNTKQCVAPDSGGGAGGLPVATQGMLAGGRNNIPSGLVRAAVAAGNPMAQQQRGMPSAMEVLQDAAAGGNPRAQQQDMDRMQQQPLLVARGRKNKMH